MSIIKGIEIISSLVGLMVGVGLSVLLGEGGDGLVWVFGIFIVALLILACILEHYKYIKGNTFTLFMVSLSEFSKLLIAAWGSVKVSTIINGANVNWLDATIATIPVLLLYVMIYIVGRAFRDMADQEKVLYFSSTS